MGYKFRRGFKAECDDYSRELRSELGLAAEAPLDPFDLANHLEVNWEPLSMFASDPGIRYLATDEGSAEFSALTLWDGCEATVVWNDFHTFRRQSADLAHELAHILLRHQPLPIVDANGRHHFDKGDEKEAEWLGPALLISGEAALHIARSDWSDLEAANAYGVSEDIIRMRTNVSGANKRVARERAKRA